MSLMIIKKEIDFVIISLNTQAVFSKIITLFPAKIKEVFLLYQYPAGGQIYFLRDCQNKLYVHALKVDDHNEVDFGC